MLALTNCVVFDGHSPDVREACIVVEDGVFKDVEAASPPSGADVLDLGGRFVMPGLIDAHYHAYWYDFAAMHNKTKVTPQLRVLQAKINLESTLRRGFTTVRDAGGGDIHLAIAQETGLIDGPRLFYPGKALSQTGGHGDYRAPEENGPPECLCGYCVELARLVDGPDEMRKVVRDHLRRGASQIKIFASGNPSLDERDPRWFANFDEEEIRVAVEETSRRRRYVMAHAHTNEAAIRCLRNGVRTIEHGTALESDGVKMVVERDAFVVPTVAALAILKELGPQVGAKRVWIEAGFEMSRRVLETLEMLHAAGAKVGFGTDLAGETHADYQLREFELRAEASKPLDVLRSVTSVNAAILQMEGKLGTIKAGAFADLLVVDGNPLDDISLMASDRNFAMIMSRGRIVKGLAA